MDNEEVAPSKLELFGPGEWIDEPDYLEFEYKGVRCEVNRNRSMGNLCGYVTVPVSHPWFGQHYSEIECDAHGGLTFGLMDGDRFVIGFDCAHWLDIVPQVERINRSNETRRLFPPVEPFIPTYKNIAFVREEIECIVNQMLEVIHEPR